MKRLARWRLLAGLIFALVFVPVEAAFAHAQLLSTEPAADALLDAAPEAVTLQFNEPVSPMAIRLVRPDGGTDELTDTTVGGTSVAVPLPGDLGDGTHVLSWRVVSADGHPIGGSLIFSVGVATGAAAAGTGGDMMVSGLLWAGKLTIFAAMFFGIGAAAFGALAPLPADGRRLAAGLCLVGFVVAPLTLGLQGLDALGLGLGSIFVGTTWSAGLSTSYGATVGVLVLGFGTALAALAAGRGRAAVGLALLAAGLAALSLVLSGHASAAAPQWLTRPAVFLHLAGILFWVGALVPLWLLLRERTEGATRALAAFSRGIPFAVAPLVASGVTLAVIQLGAPGPAWLSPYGFVLAGKLVLLAGLFALALWNRAWLTRPALAGDGLAVRRLRRSIGWEMALVALILVLVAGWRFTPPPRALAIETVAREPVMTHLIAGDTMAMLTISPGSAGPVQVDVFLGDLEHMPREALVVSVTFGNPDKGIEPIAREAEKVEGGWVVDGLNLPLGGIWQVEVAARISRFELVRLKGEVEIP